MSVRFVGQLPPDFAGRLRQIGAEVDPAAPVRDATVLADFYARNRSLWRLISSALMMITLSVVLLSAAGIYALMSFTVAQRRARSAFARRSAGTSGVFSPASLAAS